MAVCKALRQKRLPSNAELQRMIVACSKVHSNLIKEASMGLGFDRHLFALRLKAAELGLEPEIFSDPAYVAMNHNTLSTSTLASENLMLGAFGPVVENGLGIGYSMWNNRLGTIITNNKDQLDGLRFCISLENSLSFIEDILKS